MDEQIQSSMLDGTDFVARLDAIAGRIREQAAREAPLGLTEPDAGGDERWEAGQVWAHMAEFVGYWQQEIERVVADYAGEPVSFGRVRSDPGRIAAIDVGRHEQISALVDRVQDSISQVNRYLGRLTVPEWSATGRHQTRGEMDVEAIAGEFIANHLDEHLDQLDDLATRA